MLHNELCFCHKRLGKTIMVLIDAQTEYDFRL